MAELWKELHLRALKYIGNNDAAYLLEFSKKIPRFSPGCACKEHWRNWVTKNPPKYGNAGEYFAWTVEAHNNINKIIGKPTFTVEQAKEYYTKLDQEKK